MGDLAPARHGRPLAHGQDLLHVALGNASGHPLRQRENDGYLAVTKPPVPERLDLRVADLELRSDLFEHRFFAVRFRRGGIQPLRFPLEVLFRLGEIGPRRPGNGQGGQDTGDENEK